MIKRIESGIVLKKENLADGEILEAAIKEILTDKRYHHFNIETNNKLLDSQQITSHFQLHGAGAHNW